jgi:hypothetical protein
MSAWKCSKCGRESSEDFACCQTVSCGGLRAEFQSFERVVVPQKLRCVLSGALTDVRLPNGDAIWPAYFLDFVRCGWLGADLAYTQAFYETHPKKKQ